MSSEAPEGPRLYPGTPHPTGLLFKGLVVGRVHVPVDGPLSHTRPVPTYRRSRGGRVESSLVPAVITRPSGVDVG